jgi:Tfp pilus assembly protein PilW
MPLIRSLARRLARDQRGFTLMETLMAMITGIVVTGALFAILESTVRQTARLSQVAQATQGGNTAMTHIVDELHSACLSTNFAPVQAGSTPTKLIFQNGYFPEKVKEPSKEPEYSFVRQDTIEYSSAEGRLTDTTVKASGEIENGAYPAKGTSSKTVLAEKIAETEVNNEKAPVFRYFKYAESATTSTTQAASALEPVTPESSGLSSAQAKSIAAVTVSFSASPPGKKEVRLSSAAETGLPSQLSAQVIFSMGSPNSESKISAEPCE